MVKRFQPVRAHVGRQAVGGPKGGIHGGHERAARASLQAVLHQFERWAQHMDEQSIEVLREALQPTIDKAQNIYCPVKSGRLKASAYLVARKFRGNSVVEIGFARGGDPPYAALQHENTFFFHEPPTRAKFLQVAIEEDAGQIQDLLLQKFKFASGT